MSEERSDEAWMDAALAFGRRALGRCAPNPAVGALIVKDGVQIGRASCRERVYSYV
jgi:diaminohydroxyphosphoribosylaminopyrimidine deaminase/5-amino-6-(5-phosphoribosylamino)uracil reductase